MSVVINTLKRTLENTKSEALRLSSIIDTLNSELVLRQKDLKSQVDAAREIEEAIQKLEKKDASKNKKTK